MKKDPIKSVKEKAGFGKKSYKPGTMIGAANKKKAVAVAKKSKLAAKKK